MHKHPVITRIKNAGLLKRADAEFESILGIKGGERCQNIVESFVEQAAIFADPPHEGSTTVVTLDLKEVKIVFDAPSARPLALIRPNNDGVALMLCRPDLQSEYGLLYKICPHDRVLLTIDELFAREVSRFNRLEPADIGKMAQAS